MKKLASWLLIATLCVAASAIASRAQIVQRVVDQIIATTCAANNWITAIAVGGTATCAQPAFTNLSGSISNAQLGVAPTSWTPSDGSGASLTFTGVSANYTRVGNMLFIYAQLTYPSTADGSTAFISGAPVSAANANYAKQCSLSYTTVSTIQHIAMTANSSTIQPFAATGGGVTNIQLSGATLNFICIYPAA